MLQNNITPGKTSVLIDIRSCNSFADLLRCIYKMEKELPFSLTAMRQSVRIEELKELLEEYLLQFEKQAIRLEEISGLLLISVDNGRCDKVKELKEEINMTISQKKRAASSYDSLVINLIQKIINYKITSYKNLRQLAISLGMEDASNLLTCSLQDEKDKELLFSDIAERSMNHLLEIV